MQFVKHPLAGAGKEATSMRAKHVRQIVMIWQIILSCTMLFLVLLLHEGGVKLTWNVWDVQKAFAQEVKEEKENIIETDIGPDSSDKAGNVKGIYDVQPTLKEWKIEGALAALEDVIPGVQAEALYKLDELGALDRIPRKAIPKIAALLEHSDEEICLAAIEVLGRLEKGVEEYIPQLVTLLEHEDSDIRASAARALGNQGKNGQTYIPQLIVLLNDNNLEVRTSAASALYNLDKRGKAYIPEVVAMLEDRDWEVRSDAAMLLGNFGEGVRPYIPRIEELLNDKNWEVRAAAINALGKLGKVAELAIPQIATLLKDESWSVRVSAARALGDMGQAARPYIPQIVALLKDKNWEVQVAAIWALGNLGKEAKDYMPQIIAYLDNRSPQVRAAAVEALDNMGEEMKTYIPQITAMLEDENWEVRAAAARTLGNLGEIARAAIPQIIALFDDEDWYVRSNAARALGSLNEFGGAFLPQLVDLLRDEDGNVRAAATWSLGNFGKEARAYRYQILALLEDPHPGVRYGAARVLGNFGELEVNSIAAILNPIYTDPSRVTELRFLAHFIGAGKEEVEIFLQWLGQPENNYPDIETLSYAEAKKTMEVFDTTWESVVPFEELLVDLSDQIAVVVSKMKTQWESKDLPLLQRHLQHLEVIESPHAEAVKEVMTYVERKREIARLIVLLMTVCLIHPLLWVALIYVYPRSRHVRVMFFWNPYVRKIAGLGYINIILTKFPYFRQKLFEPFRENLLTDAALDNFDEESYFRHSEVVSQVFQQLLSIHEAIPNINGKIVLEGESGLGKSMFARYLMKHTTRITAYLPAEKCSGGVIEAIRSKLLGEVKDIEFLKRLVYNGAIDICIDGLHNVNQNHVKMIQFMIQASRGNILVTTQPMEWTPPATAKIYVIQPLRRDQIEHFLIGCYQTFFDHISISHPEYAQACKGYLANVLDESQPQEVLNSAQQILSNPMNLTMVALLGAHGKSPDPLHLQEQYYQMMATEYERMYRGRPFPLIQFSERVYQMRLNDEASFPSYRFPNEITCMEQYEMVHGRQSFDVDGNLKTEWYFRHEKIIEFFIAQAFLSYRDHRVARHTKEPRFRGVYALLNVLSPSLEMAQIPQPENHKEEEREVDEKGVGIVEVV
jgi:HEAT repeat protein